jgi:hypothetical protein
VAFPAYSATAGTTAVRGLGALARSLDVDVDSLADAMLKVESGANLTSDEANMLNSVVERLTEQSEVAETDSEESGLDMLALKKKKLEQLLKGI